MMLEASSPNELRRGRRSDNHSRNDSKTDLPRLVLAMDNIYAMGERARKDV